MIDYSLPENHYSEYTHIVDELKAAETCLPSGEQFDDQTNYIEQLDLRLRFMETDLPCSLGVPILKAELHEAHKRLANHQLEVKRMRLNDLMRRLGHNLGLAKMAAQMHLPEWEAQARLEMATDFDSRQ